jgi:hypothetical protein
MRPRPRLFYAADAPCGSPSSLFGTREYCSRVLHAARLTISERRYTIVTFEAKTKGKRNPNCKYSYPKECRLAQDRSQRGRRDYPSGTIRARDGRAADDYRCSGGHGLTGGGASGNVSLSVNEGEEHVIVAAQREQIRHSKSVRSTVGPLCRNRRWTPVKQGPRPNRCTAHRGLSRIYGCA